MIKGETLQVALTQVSLLFYSPAVPLALPDDKMITRSYNNKLIPPAIKIQSARR
jgi:hypothetical protein